MDNLNYMHCTIDSLSEQDLGLFWYHNTNTGQYYLNDVNNTEIERCWKESTGKGYGCLSGEFSRLLDTSKSQAMNRIKSHLFTRFEELTTRMDLTTNDPLFNLTPFELSSLNYIAIHTIHDLLLDILKRSSYIVDSKIISHGSTFTICIGEDIFELSFTCSFETVSELVCKMDSLTLAIKIAYVQVSSTVDGSSMSNQISYHLETLSGLSNKSFDSVLSSVASKIFQIEKTSAE